MPSNREKGLAFQREVKKILEERNWVVQNYPIGSRWIKVRDVLGADLIGIQHDYVLGKSQMLLVQASCDGHVKKRIETYRKYFKNSIKDVRLQIWIKTGKGKINIKEVVFHQKNPFIFNLARVINGEVQYEKEIYMINASI